MLSGRRLLFLLILLQISQMQVNQLIKTNKHCTKNRIYTNLLRANICCKKVPARGKLKAKMHGKYRICLPVFMGLYPGIRGFSWFFLAKEIKSKPRSGYNESRKPWGEREKPLVTLASNLTFMQTTAVKRVKLLIKRVTNGNLANTCLSAAIFLSGGRPGEIMLWTNHLHLGGKEWFVNRGQAKACVNDGRQESRNKNTTL